MFSARSKAPVRSAVGAERMLPSRSSPAAPAPVTIPRRNTSPSAAPPTSTEYAPATKRVTTPDTPEIAQTDAFLAPAPRAALYEVFTPSTGVSVAAGAAAGYEGVPAGYAAQTTAQMPLTMRQQAMAEEATEMPLMTKQQAVAAIASEKLDTFLARLRLEVYADQLRDAGYDDVAFLHLLTHAKLRRAVPDMKPGHVERLMDAVASMRREKGLPVAPEEDAPARAAEAEAGSAAGALADLLARDSVLRRYIIPATELSVGKEVGRGSYGTVYAGTWRGTRVAVKCVYEDLARMLALTASSPDSVGSGDSTSGGAWLASRRREGVMDALRELEREAEVAARISNHTHVVAFRGIVLAPALALVSEFMTLGSAEEIVVRASSPKYQRPSTPFHTLVSMVRDAAAGLLHLHAAGVIHRDVAARNLLVGDGLMTKVADFGFSRVLRDGASGPTSTYSASNFGPIKWMAPESFTDHRFSAESDVFAFGVTMYEALVGGAPWPDLPNLQAAIAVTQGARMRLPPSLDGDLAVLISSCWSALPSDRPSMREVHGALERWTRDAMNIADYGGERGKEISMRLVGEVSREWPSPVSHPAARPSPPSEDSLDTTLTSSYQTLASSVDMEQQVSSKIPIPLAAKKAAAASSPGLLGRDPYESAAKPKSSAVARKAAPNRAVAPDPAGKPAVAQPSSSREPAFFAELPGEARKSAPRKSHPAMQSSTGGTMQVPLRSTVAKIDADEDY